MDIFLTKEMIDCNRHLFLICCLKAYLPSTFCLNWNIKAHMKRSVIYPRDRWYCVKTYEKSCCQSNHINIWRYVYWPFFTSVYSWWQPFYILFINQIYNNNKPRSPSIIHLLEGTHTFCTCMASFIFKKTFKAFKWYFNLWKLKGTTK